MDRLPNEILQSVFAYCTKKDALRARLISMVSAAAAAPVVFRRFDLYSFAFSFKMLESLARSHLAKHVAEIVFHEAGLVEYHQDNFKPCLQENLKRGLTYQSRYGAKKVELFANQWADLWDLYQAWSLEHNELFNSPNYHNTLSEAFAALPNLQHVSTRRFAEQGWRAYPQWFPWTGFDSAHPSDMKFILCWFGRDLDRRISACMSASILNAIGYRAKIHRYRHVRQLGMATTFGWYPALTAEQISPDSPDDFEGKKEAILQAMQHIESLQLVVYDESIHQKVALGIDPCTLLRNCSRICRLELGDDYAVPGYCRSQFSSLLDSSPPVWPRLESLRMVAVGVTSQDMLAFMRSHARTLKCLSLYKVCFDDVTTVLDHIPRVLKLKKIKLTTLWTCGADHFVDYSLCYIPWGLRQEGNARRWLIDGEGEPPDWQPWEYGPSEWDEESSSEE